MNMIAKTRDSPEHKEKFPTYEKQHAVVSRIIAVYERENYMNDLYREEITDLLEELEQISDLPINNPFSCTKFTNELRNLTQTMGLGTDHSILSLYKELEKMCK